MTDSQTVLLQLLSKALFGRTAEIDNADWLEVLKEAKSQAVIKIADSALDTCKLTVDEAKQWNLAAATDIANNILIAHNHCLLNEWLEEANIPYVILKGSASASYYPIPSYRSMGDVDFLVKSKDLEQAGKVLEKYGLKPWDKEHISHIVYRAPRMHYEMHFNLAGTPHGKAGDLVREYTADIFDRSSVQRVGDGEADLPSPFHHGLILLLHTCHHLTGEGVGLRHLCDWAVFENSLSDDEFRAMFEEKLKKLGLWRFAQILTRVAIKYLGADEKEWAADDEYTVSALMEDILSGGNFGRKDSNRSIYASLLSDRGKDGVGNVGASEQFRKSINKLICHNWPSARKNRLLIPIGWVYFGTRRIIRELTGKRKKTDIGRFMGEATERRNLYKHLYLYKAEL